MANDESYMAFLKNASSHPLPQAQIENVNDNIKLFVVSETDSALVPIPLSQEIVQATTQVSGTTDLDQILANSGEVDVKDAEIINDVGSWIERNVNGDADAKKDLLNRISSSKQARAYKVKVDFTRYKVYIFILSNVLEGYSADIVES